MTALLPELKSGDVLITASGRKVIVKRIANKGKHGTAYDEPIYRLIHLLSGGRQQVGNAIWTREDIQAAGCKLA